MAFFKKKPSLQTEQDFLTSISAHQATMEQAKQHQRSGVSGMGVVAGASMSVLGGTTAIVGLTAGAAGIITTVAAVGAIFPIAAGVAIGGGMVMAATKAIDWLKNRQIKTSEQGISKTMSTARSMGIKLPSLNNIGSRLDQILAEQNPQMPTAPSLSRKTLAI